MPVVNTTDGKPTGTQNLGTILVAYHGKASGIQEYSNDRVTLPVATASGSVDGEFTEIRYYSGDTSS